MTPKQAAEAAVELLTEAQGYASMPEVAAALVGIADGWTRLYAALSATSPKPQPVTVNMDPRPIALDPAKIAEEINRRMGYTTKTSTSATDAVYRERAALVAFLAAVYRSAIAYNDPAAPDWPVIYIDTPQGQMTWHLAERDLDLFEHVQHLAPDDAFAVWDGHTTDEKYERLAACALMLHADARFPIQP